MLLFHLFGVILCLLIEVWDISVVVLRLVLVVWLSNNINQQSLQTQPVQYSIDDTVRSVIKQTWAHATFVQSCWCIWRHFSNSLLFQLKAQSAAGTTASGQMSNFILNIDLTYKTHFTVWIPLGLSVFKPRLLIRQTLQCLAGIFQPAEIILLTDYDTNSISMLLFKAVSIYLFFPRCFDTPSNHSWPLKVEHMNVDLPDYKRLD